MAIYIGISNCAARLTVQSSTVGFNLTAMKNQLQARIDALRKRMSGIGTSSSDEIHIAEQLTSGTLPLLNCFEQ